MCIRDRFTAEQKSLALTDAGRRLQPYAQAVLKAVEELRQAAQPRDAVTGRVRVGMMETVVHTLLPDFVKAMGEQLPGVELDLSVDLTVNLIENLMRGELDLILCVGQEPRSPYVLAENLLNLSIHWIARKDLVDAQDALGQVFRHQIMTQMSNTAPYNAAVSVIQKLAADQGVPATRLRISSSPSLAALVALAREGLGVAVVPGLLVKEQLDRGELVQLPLPTPQPLTIAQWHALNASPATLCTAEIVQQVCAAYCARHAPGGWIALADTGIRSGPGSGP